MEIRKLLRKELFGKPRPHNRRLFEEAHESLFPGRSLFEDFLNETGGQNSRIIARKILFRLIYEHSFPPPPSLLDALVAFEDKERSRQRDGHVPRDHFVHLVNLYLLGIYLFSYHKKIHKECCSYLNLRKREIHSRLYTKHSKGLDNPYAVFASFWTYFVLYHDLGYPFESVPPKERREYSKIYQKYSKSHFSVLGLLTAKSLAKYVVAKYATDMARKDTVNTCHLRHVEAMTVVIDNTRVLPVKINSGKTPISEWQAFQKVWGSARLVPMLKNRKNLNALRGVTRDKRILGVVECTKTGQLIAMVPCETDGSKISYCYARPKKDWPRGCPTGYDSLWKLLFGPKQVAEGELEVSYFVQYPFVDIRTLGALYKEVPSADRLWSIFEDGDDSEFLETIAGQADDNSDLGFVIFSALIQEFDMTQDIAPKPGENVQTANLRNSSKYKSQLPTEIAKAVQSVYSELLDRGEEEVYDIKILLGLPNSELVDELYKGISTEKFAKAVKKKISKGYVSAMEGGRKDYVKFAKAFGTGLHDCLGEVISRRGLSGLNGVRFTKDFSKEHMEKRLKGHGLIDNYMAEAGYPALQEILKSYTPSWVKDNEKYDVRRFFDHSVMSTVTLVSVA